MSVADFACNRLKRDYNQLLIEPIDNIWAHPLKENIFEWHYVIRGPSDTPFADGLYLGKLVFPKDYPLKGPSIYMLTPNGKFTVNKRLCVAGISDLHPEMWSAANTVSSVLISFFSFMVDEKVDFFQGMVSYTHPKQRISMIKELAQKSWSFNMSNQVFCTYFPFLVDEAKRLNAQKL